MSSPSVPSGDKPPTANLPQPVLPGDTVPTADLPKPLWLRALTTTTGKVAAITAFFEGLLAVLDKAFSILKHVGIEVPTPWSWVIGVAVLVGAIVLYIREVVRLRRGIIHRPFTVFIGSNPFSEKDGDRFFGRGGETDEILRQLDNSQIAFYIVHADSGCGKTSLIRAGLIPRLESEYGHQAIYIRLYDEPERNLREALRSLNITQDIPIGSKSGTDGTTTLMFAEPLTLGDELRAAESRVQRPLILFIDAFEEFFTSGAPDEEKKRVLEFLRACVQGPGKGRAKIVFGIRSDFLYLMDELDLNKSRRYRLRFFDINRTRSIVKLSLEYAKKKEMSLPWSDALIERVLSDLEITQRSNGKAETIILPAELQIVCQMVQARGWTQVGEYPGKVKLIPEYVLSAIDNSTKPAIARRILSAMVKEDGDDREKPQTTRQIATRVRSDDLRVIGECLAYLDRECHLVDQAVVNIAPESGREPSYQLSHRYLVHIITGLSGTVLDETRRANILLRDYEKRVHIDQAFRIPIRDCWLISRHASERLTPEVRHILHASERLFSKRACAVVLTPVLVITGVRYGTVHFDIEKSNRVVIKRGLPVLLPLLGSDSVMIDTGLFPQMLSKDGEAACEAKRLAFNLWPFEGKKWSGVMSDWLREATLERVIGDQSSRLAGYQISGSTPNPDDRSLRMIRATLDTADARVTKTLHEYLKDSSPDKVLVGATTLIDLNAIDSDTETALHRLLSDGHPDIVLHAVDLLIATGRKDPEIVNALRHLLAEHGVEQPQFDWFGLALRSKAPPGTAQSLDELEQTDKLWLVAIEAAESLHISDPWFIDVLRAGLQRRSRVHGDTLANSLIQVSANSLLELGIKDDQLVSALLAHLKDPDVDASVVKLCSDSLLGLGIKDNRLVSGLRSRLTDPNSEIEIVQLSAAVLLKAGVKDAWFIAAMRRHLSRNLYFRVVNTQGDADWQHVPQVVGGRSNPKLIPIAVDTLLHLGVRDSWFVQSLQSNLQSRDPDIFHSVALALFNMNVKGDYFRNALRVHLRDSNLQNVDLAASILLRLPPLEGWMKKDLEARLGDEDPSVVSTVARSLLVLGSTDLVKVLSSRITSSDSQMFRTVVMLLRQAGGGPELVKALRARLGDQNLEIAMIAADALLDMNVKENDVIGSLRKFLASDTKRVTARAAVRLIELGYRDQEILDFLICSVECEWAEDLIHWPSESYAVNTYALRFLTRPSDQFGTALDRLWNELSGSRGERSIGYRRLVQTALALLAEQQTKSNPAHPENGQLIRSKLRPWLTAAEPHRRLAAIETLQLIDQRTTAN